MTNSSSIIEKTRHDAQELHKKISANIAKAEAATWADVKTAEADTPALAARMKTLADEQGDAVKTSIKSAIARMDAAGKLAETKAGDSRDSVKHADDALLESSHKAAQSLSEAVAAMRTKAAAAIAPKSGAK